MSSEPGAASAAGATRSPKRPGFRPPVRASEGKRHDIQGLRAVAVLLVVLYHLWPDRLTGGYIGVDVFFVISGYLITAHLLREAATTGTVSLTSFWARRIRRLLPAAFTVLLVTGALSFLLPTTERMSTIDQVMASAVYLQNWFLARMSVDYLASDSAATMVQHYWTLSAEEQFYIVWPLVVIAAVWLAARLRRVSGDRAVFAAFLAVFAASLLISVVATLDDPATAYFITPTRAWEFAAGGIITMLPLASWTTRLGRVVKPVLSWLAVLVLLACAVVYSDATPFPGWVALFPVAAAAVLLFVGDDRSTWSPQYLFAAGPSQFVGDVSYSLYLWHWPLIVIAPTILDDRLTAAHKIVILGASILLAHLTKRFVEDPARRVKGRLRRRLPGFAFMTAGVAVIVAGGLSVQGIARAEAAQVEAKVYEKVADPGSCIGAYALDDDDCPDPYSETGDTENSLFAVNDVAWQWHPEPGCEKPADAVPGAKVIHCRYNDAGDDKPTVALVGDSHAQHLVNAFKTIAEERDWRLVTYTRGGCSGLETAETSQDRVCVDWSTRIMNEVLDDADIDTVVFANRSSMRDVDDDTAAAAFDRVADSGKRVAVLRDTPAAKGPKPAPDCIELHGEAEACGAQPEDWDDFMRHAADRSRADVATLDLNDALCDERRCHVVIGGLIVYYDVHHFTNAFAVTLAPRISAALGPLLPQR